MTVYHEVTKDTKRTKIFSYTTRFVNFVLGRVFVLNRG